MEFAFEVLEIRGCSGWIGRGIKCRKIQKSYKMNFIYKKLQKTHKKAYAEL